MIHLSPSKILDFLDEFTGKHNFTVISGQPAQKTSFGQGPGSSINVPGYNSDTDDLRWDEYGNPYIADTTIH